MMSKGLNWDQRCVEFILNCFFVVVVFLIGPSLACMAGLISEAT